MAEVDAIIPVKQTDDCTYSLGSSNRDDLLKEGKLGSVFSYNGIPIQEAPLESFVEKNRKAESKIEEGGDFIKSKESLDASIFVKLRDFFEKKDMKFKEQVKSANNKIKLNPKNKKEAMQELSDAGTQIQLEFADEVKKVVYPSMGAAVGVEVASAVITAAQEAARKQRNFVKENINDKEAQEYYAEAEIEQEHEKQHHLKKILTEKVPPNTTEEEINEIVEICDKAAEQELEEINEFAEDCGFSEEVKAQMRKQSEAVLAEIRRQSIIFLQEFF